MGTQKKALFLSGISFTIFLICFLSIYTHVLILHINTPVHNYFITIRNASILPIVTAFTIAADKHLLIYPCALIILLMLYKKCFKLTLSFCALMGTVVIATLALKNIIMSLRPPGLLVPFASFSFPSGHSVLAVSFYGFVTYLMAQNHPKEQSRKIYTIGTLFILFLLLTRLYLNAHWLTDIIGGASLSLCITTLFIYIIEKFNFKRTQFAKGIILIIIILGFSTAFFIKGIDYYTDEWRAYRLAE